ncbi:MAG: Gx transporter family protein [Clostridia bacterium]|nr:Gx transporter family protein [Clostridia bacterium]
MRKGRKLTTVATAQCGLLTAMMLVLGLIESMLPTASLIPGIKLGLSNSVLLFALYIIDARAAFVLMLLKVLLSGVTFAGVNAMMYAFAGGLCSMLGMIALKKMGFSIITVSMLGAALHNTGQVLMAVLVLKTPALLTFYLPILLFVGLICGAATGVAARATIAHIRTVSPREVRRV